MAQLPQKVHDRIEALCKKGDALAEREKYPAALEQYWAAWDLLPEPKTDWEAATWILGAIGDANFLGGDFCCRTRQSQQCHALSRRHRQSVPASAARAMPVRARRARPGGRRIDAGLHG